MSDEAGRAAPQPSAQPPQPAPDGAGPLSAASPAEGLPALLAGAPPRPTATGRLSPEMLSALQRGAGNASVLGLLRHVSPLATARSLARAPADGQPLQLLVDGASAGPNQLTRDGFLDALDARVRAVAEAALDGTPFSSAQCPWIDRWIAAYRQQPAAELEAAIVRYAADAATARTAADYLDFVAARVEDGIAAWRHDGTLPPEAVAAANPPQASATTPQPAAGAQVARSMRRGEPLRPDLAARLSRAFGADLSNVRVHRDEAAAALARSVSARAVALGRDIAVAPGAYAPGTPVGDVLLAHEVAHALQYEPGAPLLASAAAEREAEAATVQVLARAWVGEELAPAPPAPSRSGLALRRCGDEIVIPPQPAQRPYAEVIAELRRIQDHKAAVLAGTLAPDPVLLGRQDAVVEELRRLGIRMDVTSILDRLAADPSADLRRVRGRVVRTPEGDVPWGTRIGFLAELDYVPPGRNVEYAWRWKSAPDGHAYQLAAPGPRGSRAQFEIGESFWLTERDGEVGRSHHLEVVAHVYLGAETTEQTTIACDPISVVAESVPDPLSLVAEPPVAVTGALVRFHLGGWAPDATRHQLDWEVDGQMAATDQVGFQRRFAGPGRHRVVVHVSQVRRMLGVRERTPLRDAALDLEVQDTAQASAQMLAQMQPGSPSAPSTRDLEQSIVASIAEAERHAAEGGEQREHWTRRVAAQRHRLAELRTGTFDLAHGESLPDDPAVAEASHTYNGPVVAVLALPEGAGVQPLSMYLSAQRQGGEWVAVLTDMTSRDVYHREGRGATALEAYDHAFHAWIDDHPYPRGGTVTYRFAAAGWTVPLSFRTKDTAWDTAVAWLDGIVTVGGYIAAGLLLAAPEATVTKWLGLIILTASVARSAIAIRENLSVGIDPVDARNVVEGVSIVASVVGAGGSALRQVGIRTLTPTVYRTGSWLVMGALAADAGMLAFTTDQALSELRAIQADPATDDQEKSVAIVRTMAGIAARGALFFVSNRDLVRQGIRASDFVRTEPRLSTRSGPRGELNLSTGSRLDLGLEFREAGDIHVAELVRTRRISDGELLDRQLMLPWLRRLPVADVAAFSRRLTTGAMARLQGISASEARLAFDRIGDDGLANRLALVMNGPRLQVLGTGLARVRTALAGHPVLLPVLNRAAELEASGNVAGYEAWVAQTASRVPGSGAPTPAQVDDVRRLTGELSTLEALAGQYRNDPTMRVRFSPAPPPDPRTGLTPRSFDITVEQRPPAGGAAAPAPPARLVEVETVLTPVSSSINLHAGVAHAASKLPRDAAGAPIPSMPAAGSREAAVVLAEWPPTGGTRIVAPDGSYQQTVPGRGVVRTGHIADDLVRDLQGRALDDSGAPFLDRVTVIDGRTGRPIFSLVNDPDPAGPGRGRKSWRRE